MITMGMDWCGELMPLPSDGLDECRCGVMDGGCCRIFGGSGGNISVRIPIVVDPMQNCYKYVSPLFFFLIDANVDTRAWRGLCAWLGLANGKVEVFPRGGEMRHVGYNEEGRDGACGCGAGCRGTTARWVTRIVVARTILAVARRRGLHVWNMVRGGACEWAVGPRTRE